MHTKGSLCMYWNAVHLSRSCLPEVRIYISSTFNKYILLWVKLFNASKSGQKWFHFAYDFFNCIFLAGKSTLTSHAFVCNFHVSGQNDSYISTAHLDTLRHEQHVDENFTEDCSNWQHVSIGLGNGLGTVRREAKIWINDNQAHRRMHASLGPMD